MKDFTIISGTYKQRNYTVSSKADNFDMNDNDYASADYIEQELGKTIKGYNGRLGGNQFQLPFSILNIILLIPVVAGLAWVYESVGREAGIIVTLFVTICWHIVKNREFIKKEGVLYISFSFYALFFVVLAAVNLIAQFYRISQVGLEYLIGNLNYFELLCQSSLVPALSVMAFSELLLHCLVDRGQDLEDDEYADFIFFFSDHHR